MGQTATQKILAKHAGRSCVEVGELITCDVDLVLGNDITAPVAIGLLKDGEKVFDGNKIALVLDHFAPCKDIKSAEQCKCVRDFARAQNITHFYDVGSMGIEHALLPEQGLVRPSDLIIGADSHTCTYGALGCFSTGIGSTDMAAAMLTGKCWFKVPSAIKVELRGNLKRYTTGKDVVLTLIGMLGVDGATYRSLEFFGNVSALDMDARFTIANMAIECGAKNAFFPLDDEAKKYLIEHGAYDENYFINNTVTPDSDAVYEREITLDLDTIVPTVAFPHLPSNVRRLGVDDIGKIEIQQAVIGSCTNGRIQDMRAAAEILKGRKVASGVRCIVIPATNAVYRQCIKEGLIDIFIDAGAVVSTPTCGPCLGGHMGILASKERCISTTNRNFVGRMGATDSEVYLASPYVAAASAVKGYIAGAEELI